ncbi:unnamed protein product [Vicia faba]|uniref:S-locus glycoprotein domain-containing protein n=1 Tax=Vicia faba TaxID=3906 RepID=A0AAV0YE99_VICFA|nr:unnamed protein product [Vicia faba]
MTLFALGTATSVFCISLSTIGPCSICSLGLIVSTTCDVYSFCGAFSICDDNSLLYCTCLSGFEPNSVTDWNQQDHLGGCIRKESLECKGLKSYNGMFVVVPNVALAPQALFSGDEVRCKMAQLVKEVALPESNCEENVGVRNPLGWVAPEPRDLMSQFVHDPSDVFNVI